MLSCILLYLGSGTTLAPVLQKAESDGDPPRESELRRFLQENGLGPTSLRFAASRLRGLPGCPEWLELEGKPHSAVLVAGTRASFEQFRLSGTQGDHPYERWTEERVEKAVLRAELRQAQVIFSHQGPPFLPLQRVAELCGFGAMSPCGLIFHSQYGLWISLVAAIIWADEAPAPSSSLPEPAPLPCSSCSAPCQLHWERAQKGLPMEEADRPLASHLSSLSDSQKQLTLIRLVCPYRREARYSEEQLAHHYGSVSEEQLEKARSS